MVCCGRFVVSALALGHVSGTSQLRFRGFRGFPVRRQQCVCLVADHHSFMAGALRGGVCGGAAGGPAVDCRGGAVAACCLLPAECARSALASRPWALCGLLVRTRAVLGVLWMVTTPRLCACL